MDEIMDLRMVSETGELIHEMHDGEIHGRINEQSDRLVSDRAVTRRQSRSLYRNWVALSKKAPLEYAFQSQSNVASRISSSSLGNEVDVITESSCSLIEDRADEIVRHMEQSQTLMEDNPKSNIDRIETLRVMTEYLTLKRTVKRKLTKSITPTSKALSFSKRLRYRVSIFFWKIRLEMKSILSNFELWYSSLKVIEGHFGSSVASYFKFLRKLFLLNACIFILMLVITLILLLTGHFIKNTFHSGGKAKVLMELLEKVNLFFIMIPQLLFRFIQFVDDVEPNNEVSIENETIIGRISPYVMMKNDPYKDNGEFRLGNLFTGEGFLTNTILFYGFYTNTSLKLVEGLTFNIPASYFFTSAVSYCLIFFFLFTSVAVSYRKCYIEASGGMNNTFSNKIFCGWDFGIATRQAAELKSKSIYIEVKELLDEVSRSKRKKSCAHAFYTTVISFSLNGIILFLLGVGGIYSWKYLDQQMTQADTATTMMMWLILTMVIAVAPVLFSLITHVEGFESQSSALYMTLIRTFTLYAVVVAVVVAYRLNRSAESECWETILGQDMYRLVLLDFIFGLMGTALSEFIRYRIFVTMWEGIGCPEFDIARSTMNLIYNQTLFYVGLYFSPVLSLIITIKMFLTFYIKKWGAVYNCKPFLKPWRASQAHTVYLSIAFLSFFSVVIAYGYIITSVKTSNCGPFRGEKYIYMSVLNEIAANKDSTILTILYYVTRPGVVGILLMALVLGVYYMRAVALARIHVVNHLRHLLLLKAEDRKLLLSEISKYTKAQQMPMTEDKSVFPGEGLNEPDFTSNGLNKQGRRKSGGGIDNSKSSPVSLNDIPSETDKSLMTRSRIFNSVQNLNGCCLVGDDVSTDPVGKVKKKESFEMADLAKGSSSSEQKKPSYMEIDFNKIIVEEDTNSVRGHRLNFNPIFTESVPFEPENEENTRGIESEPNENDSFPSGSNEVGTSVRQQDQDGTGNDFMYYVRFQERMPSRISFESKYDKNRGKKKKRN